MFYRYWSTRLHLTNFGLIWSLYWKLDEYCKGDFSNTILYIVTYIEQTGTIYIIYAWPSGNAWVLLILRSLDRFHQVMIFYSFHLSNDKNRELKLHFQILLYNFEYEHTQYKQVFPIKLESIYIPIFIAICWKLSRFRISTVYIHGFIFKINRTMKILYPFFSSVKEV